MKKFIYMIEAAILVVGCWLLMSYNFSDSQLFSKKIENKKDEQPVEENQPVKRRKFVSNKLWRDDAPVKLEAEDDAIVHVKVLDDDKEFAEQLRLIEEASEIRGAIDQYELTNVIADIYEVIDCIIAQDNLSREQIIAVQDKKRADR